MSDHIGKVIFIAQVSPTMQNYKENLVKELEHYGCVVKEGSMQIHGMENIHETIEQCDIAIHLLSDKDQIVDSSGKGFEESQIHSSVQHLLSQKLIFGASENGFKIYAWHLKSSAENIYKAEQVPAHLNKIQQLDEVELLRTNFEEFKYYLLQKIELRVPKVADEFYIRGNDNLSVYFLYDAVDKAAASPYIEYLGKRGFTVLLPLFDSNIMAVRQMHTSYLKKFDIAIIFAIDAGINWVNMKIMDILKSPGLGRDSQILGKAGFVVETNELKVQLKNRGFDYCPITKHFCKEALEDFLFKIKG